MVSGVVTEMQSNAFRVSIFQTVVQPLVVTEIEALLLEFPFKVPIGLRDEEEIRMCLLSPRGLLPPSNRCEASRPRGLAMCVQRRS